MSKIEFLKREIECSEHNAEEALKVDNIRKRTAYLNKCTMDIKKANTSIKREMKNELGA